MRFGLNSGPTTGGVLRGEKARFQLFGDVRDHHSQLRVSVEEAISIVSVLSTDREHGSADGK
jgi:hypothetical protein